MTATTTHIDPTPGDRHAEGPEVSAAEAWAHDKRYWIVALFLGVLTAIEVSTYTAPDLYGSTATAILLVLMAIKFFTVTWEFMHLRIDRKKYRSSILTIVFYFGLLLAAAVYIVTLMTFRFFQT